MRSLIVLTFLAALVTLVLGHGNPNRECVRNIDAEGYKATCGGYPGYSCPPGSVLPCKYYQGANWGPCCLSCPFNQPPGRMCSRFFWCPMGQRCVYPRMPSRNGPPRGVCCYGFGRG